MNNPSTTKAPLADYLAHLPLAEEGGSNSESASFSELHARLAERKAPLPMPGAIPPWPRYAPACSWAP